MASNAEPGIRPAAPDRSSWRRRRERQLGAGLVILAAVLGLLSFQPEFDMGGDNAEYLILARSLSTGHGYTCLGAPVPHPETQRPIGYPLFLAGFMRLFGEHLTLLKLTSLLCLLLAVWLSYRLLTAHREVTPGLAAAAIGLFLLNPQVLSHASTTAPEMLYIALSAVALLAGLQAVGPPKASGRARQDSRAYGSASLIWVAMAAVAAVAAVYVRPNGLTLLPALGIVLALHRRWGGLLLGIGLSISLLMPLVISQRRAMQAGPTYMSYMSTSENDSGDQEVRTVAEVLQRTGRIAAAQTLNLGQLLFVRPSDWSLRPRPQIDDPEPTAAIAAETPRPSPLRLVRHAARYVVGVVALIGFVITWRGRGSLIHWFVLMNVLLLLATPFPRGRYLVPLLPFFAWFLFVAAMTPARWLAATPLSRRRLRQAIGAALLLVAAALTTVALSQRLIVNWENRGRSWHDPARYEIQGTDFVNYVAAAEWIGQHAPADSVVVCRKPYNVYWMTGRSATWVPMWEKTPEGFLRACSSQPPGRGVLVLEDGFANRFHGDLTNRIVRPALREHPQAVRPLLRLSGPRTVVWELQRPAAAVRP